MRLFLLHVGMPLLFLALLLGSSLFWHQLSLSGLVHVFFRFPSIGPGLVRRWSIPPVLPYLFLDLSRYPSRCLCLSCLSPTFGNCPLIGTLLISLVLRMNFFLLKLRCKNPFMVQSGKRMTAELDQAVAASEAC